MEFSELTQPEESRIDVLINEAKKNKIKAQQLAMDAGKLLTITTKRFDEYKNKGFLKRCWYSISGKQGELDRANQNDLIKMQNFSWHYLQKLQEQNLIQGQAIAVIRNNLRDITGEVSEIHSIISAFIDKMQKHDMRIKNLEEKTTILDWHNKLSIRNYSKDFQLLCALEITFDYFKVLQNNNIDHSYDTDDLILAMTKFQIEYKKEFTISAFISALFDEVDKVGFNKFCDVILLSFDEKKVKSEFILENISSAGYNALYQFENEMSKMQNLANELGKETPEIKQKMLKVISSVLNNPNTEYTLIELLEEVVSGNFMTVEIYKAEKGISSLDLPQEEEDEDEEPYVLSIESLLENHVSINYHPFLTTHPSKEEKMLYIESFSLVLTSTNITEKQRSYILALSKLFECDDCQQRINYLLKNQKEIKIKEFITLLKDAPLRLYTWIADVMTLGMHTEETQNIVVQLCHVLKINKHEIEPFFQSLKLLDEKSTPTELLKAIKETYTYTDFWKTFFDFNTLSLQGAFDDIKKEILDIKIPCDGLRCFGEIPLPRMSIRLEDKLNVIYKILDLPNTRFNASVSYSAEDIEILTLCEMGRFEEARQLKTLPT